MSQLSKTDFAEIPADNPWKNDVLERKAVADYLTPIIGSIRQPFVVSLHSPYGTGKTYFLKAWRQDLENQKFHTAYFNAWETDFTQDALSAFVASLKRQLFDEANPDIAEKFKRLMEGMGGFLRKEALPMLGRAAIKKFLGEEIADAVQEGLASTDNKPDNIAAAFATETLADQEVAEQSMAGFKKALGEIVESIAVGEDDDKRKVIVFVDELDRCRPTYAIEVLECIKHFFSVPGLVFVLAIDDEQLKNAIASVYGSQMDGDGYLRRFIDWRFALPDPSQVNYGRFLMDRMDLTKLFDSQNGRDAIGFFKDTFGVFSSALGLSLRDQEKSASEIELAFRSDRNWKPETMLAWAVLGPLRMARRDVVDQYISNHVRLSEFLEDLDSRVASTYSDQTGFNWKYVRPHIHGLFLGGSARSSVRANITELELDLEHKNSQDEDPDNHEHLERKVKYLKSVVREANPYLHTEDDYSSYAAVANGYLEGAAQIRKGR